MDPRDTSHSESVHYLRLLENPEYYLAGFATLEYDIVLKSRGFSPRQRMTYHAVLSHDFPTLISTTRRLSPEIMYMTAQHEQEGGVDYLDAGDRSEVKRYVDQNVSKCPILCKFTGL